MIQYKIRPSKEHVKQIFKWIFQKFIEIFNIYLFPNYKSEYRTIYHSKIIKFLMSGINKSVDLDLSVILSEQEHLIGSEIVADQLII